MVCNGLWQNNIAWVHKNSDPVLSHLWMNVHEILGQCRRPFRLSNALPDCLYHVSFSTYSPLSLKVVEKLNKCKSIWPQFISRGTTPTFLQQIVSAIYRPPFDKVWLSSVCWSPSAKPGNEVECEIYWGWVKTHIQFEAVCGPKFMSFWDNVGEPL